MRELLIYHTIALVSGIILDWIIGDPYWMPHPIRLIGKLIANLDRAWLGPKEAISSNPSREKKLGFLMCLIVAGYTGAVTAVIVVGAYWIAFPLGIVVEAVLTFYILAAKSLCVESMKVFRALSKEPLHKAQIAVSMIVGRDTEILDETGVAKAAIETVAENTSDGVIAPLLYTAIGGPILGLIYKSVNTMDSMVGYHNDRYEYIGYAPARLDDIVNYIPARLSAVFMIIASMFIGIFKDTYNFKNGWKIYKRDRYNHKSPNSAQTESACAGILGIELAGNASYFGKVVEKPFIGDAVRGIEYEDIKRSNVLMFGTEIVCIVLVLAIIGVILL